MVETEFADVLEGGLTYLRGSETTVTVVDRHGNRRTALLLSETDLASWALSQYDPRTAGRLSGVTNGVAEVPELIQLVRHQPRAVLAGIQRFASEADAELVYEMVRGMPAEIRRTQHDLNPNDQPSDDPAESFGTCIYGSVEDGRTYADYCAYAQGWYEGYGAFLAWELFTGAAALRQGVDTARDVATSLGRAARNVDELGPALRNGADGLTPTLTRRVAPDGGGGGSYDLEGVRELLREQGASVGRTNDAIEALEAIDARHLQSLSEAEIASLGRRLSRSASAEDAAAFVDDLENAEDVRAFLDEDVAATNRMVEWYRNADEHRYVDSDLDARDLVTVSRRGDISDTMMVVRRGDEDVVWLERGTDHRGETHIIGRHITGRLSDQSADIFPTGVTITRGGQTYRIPNRMSQSDVNELIYRALRQGERQTGDAARIVYPREGSLGRYGIDRIRVIADENQQVVTAYPTAGEAVITVPPE